MFLSTSEIIEYFDSLINQVDIFYEKYSPNLKDESNSRNQIIQKIKEVKYYNLKIIDAQYRYCYFFGKIGNLFSKYKAKNDIESKTNELQYGILLITNDIICDQIFEKLR